VKQQSILYIRLPCQKVYPGGVVALADYIHKSRPKVRQRILDLALVEKNLRKETLIREIASFDPDILAFSWRDIQIFAPHQGDAAITHAFKFLYSPRLLDKLKASLYGAAALLKYGSSIKENLKLIHLAARRFPKKKIVLGGSAFSVFPEQLIERAPPETVGVIGEGEAALLSVLEGKNLLNHRIILKQNGNLVYGKRGSYLAISENGPTDFAYIASIFPQFSSYLSEYIGIQTKRGCTQKCLFCLYRFIEGPKIRYRKPEVIGREIEDLSRNFGVSKIWLTDATFCPDKSSIPFCEETLEEIIRRRAEIEWQGYIRIENLTQSLARKMLASGISAFELSLTSGSQKIIDRLNLGFALEDIWRACEMIKQAGYQGQPIIVNYALNAPGETRETLQESLFSLRKLEEIFGAENVQPFIFFLAVQPHTGLEKLAIKENLLPPDYNRLSLNPSLIRGLIYNPPPLGEMLAQLFLEASGENEQAVGKEVFRRLEEKLTC